MVDCLSHAVAKEEEIPKIIRIVFEKLTNEVSNSIEPINRKMRTAKEIMKDYGLEV